MFEQKKFENDAISDIKSFQERVRKELTTIKNVGLLPFGVNYLDECFGGIRPNDFIVIAARTGFGKTELARIIALRNAPLKRVHFFALEAEPNEIELRIKYSFMANGIYNELKEEFGNFRFNYADWRNGLYEDDQRISALSEVANDFISEMYQNLKTYYQVNSSITEDNVDQILTGIQNETDLIIIDHLHYFTISDDNENRGTKKLMVKLRELSLSLCKPIVLLAHIRKADFRNKNFVPDLEDIHGSSDISKIATKVITMSKCTLPIGTQTKLPTFIRAAKYRLDGSRTRYYSVCNFDIQQNKYGETYHMGEFNFENEKPELFEEKEKAPKWAKSFIAIEKSGEDSSIENKEKSNSFRRQRIDLDG